jgi:thiol-disulfide isomerase/thioredoxin
MPNILSVVSNLVTPYKTLIVITCVIIIFSLVSYYIYKKYGESIIKKQPYADVANANRRSDVVEILLFSVDWCPHCKIAKPEWNKFVNNTDGTKINGYTIKCVNIDCTDPDDVEIQSATQKYGIVHFPVVKMLRNGDVIDFDAKISEESLNKFTTTMAV